MASPSSLVFTFLALIPSLFLITIHVHAQSPEAAPPRLNLTAILEKGGQYTTLMRLLNTTQAGNQMVNQLRNSDQGFTLLAPIDNAFNNLEAGTLNSLSTQQQVALLLYHVLPRFYTFEMFSTISNPVRTEATGNDGGLYSLNFTTTSNQVNVSTGIVEALINNALYLQSPLAVYQLDDVLLPLDLFGAKPTTPAPSPSQTPIAKPWPRPLSTSRGPSASDREPSTNIGSKGKNAKWSLAIGIGLVIIRTILRV